MKTFKLSILVLGLISISFLSGCGTLRGAGEDLESAGRAVQDVVD